MSSLQVPSLSMLSNPLPPVINKPQPPIELEVKHQDAPEENVKPPKDKTVLILHTRNVSMEEEQLCRKFGPVRHYNPSMVNIDLSQVVEEGYIFVDIRNKYYRINISKVDLDKFRVCALVNTWEKHNNIFDDFCEVNMMTKLPFDVKVAFKHEFDELLCNKKLIKSPGNSCLSLLSYLVNIWDELKRKPS